jgi:hypothetical protein
MMIHAQSKGYTPAQSRALEDLYLQRAIDLKIKHRPTRFRSRRLGLTATRHKAIADRLENLVRLIGRPMTTPEIRDAAQLTPTQTKKALESLRGQGRIRSTPSIGGKPATHFPIATQ